MAVCIFQVSHFYQVSLNRPEFKTKCAFVPVSQNFSRFPRNAHSRRSDCSSLQDVANLLNVKHSVWLLVRGWNLEEGVMFVWVKFFTNWIFLHQSMLAKHLKQLRLSQLEALVHILEVLTLLQGLGRHRRHSLVQHIGNFKKILTKALYAKNLGV